MNWRNAVLVVVAICLGGCASNESRSSSTNEERLALPEAQKQYCGLIRECLRELDAAQSALDNKKSQAAIIRILDQYKALTPQTRSVAQWVGRCLPNSPDKSGSPIADGLILADPDAASSARIMFIMPGGSGVPLSPGQLARFSGSIASVKVEYLTPMEGRLFEAYVSTRGEIGFDATGFNLRGLTKARVLVEIDEVQRLPY
jgi:hypothetical protein